MARWPRTGSGISALYERTPEFEEMVAAGLVAGTEPETTLPHLVAELGLAPLSADDEETIRFELGKIISAGQQNFADSPKHNPDDRLTVADVAKTLRQIADDLDSSPSDADRMDSIEQVLQGIDTGFRTSHNIAVTSKLIETLIDELGEYRRARDTLREFRTQPRLVANACRRAADNISALKGRSGSLPIDWSGFWRVLVLIAECNGIRPTFVVNRRTHKVQGRLIEIAEGFERLLPPYLRSNTRDALVKRLRRPLRR